MRDLQNNLISELERLGTPVAAIHYILTDLLAHKIRLAQIAQRVRRAKERRERLALQAALRPELRKRCIDAYQARCAYCDKVGSHEAGPDGEPWTLDRIFPGALGGEYEPLNVALACRSCNTKKAAAVTLCPPPSLAEREAA